MATCVRVLPTGTVIATAGTTSVKSKVPLITDDPTCASGLVLMSQNDLKLQVSPEPVSPERVQDMYDVFALLMVAFAAVWGLKQIARIFSGDMERD